MSTAGSCEIAWSISSKELRAWLRRSWMYCRINLGFFTLSLLVAKWPCQNSVIFSSNGCGVWIIRRSHHALRLLTEPEAELSYPSYVLLKAVVSVCGLSSISIVRCGPSDSACWSWFQLAPNAARRNKWPAWVRFQGCWEFGWYTAQAQAGSFSFSSISEWAFCILCW